MLIKNNKYYIYIILFILFLDFSSAFAQRKKKIHAKGLSISLDKTPNEALNEAIKNAKKNALNKAGITEQLFVSSVLFERSNENKSENYFNEISSIESNANIVIDSIYKEERGFDKYGNMVISVDIDATVFKYNKKKDAAFFFKIEGLKDIYYKNESLSFSFIPSHDGFLTIFVFNEKETILLYPIKNIVQDYLSDKKSYLFIKGEKVFFPIHDAYKPGYLIELDNIKDEMSNLIFVFTKNYIPWIESKINRNAVLHWIYKIPLNKREVEFRNILLKHID